ncbi:hypothetical protein COLO4_31449 [Corchorus olitorius]|uniref:Uncharacterized protein n=1 Tax=Corchorus olitorius TaxID=93759 RepID=A0A1R3H4L4_9ROSI|nr:hypothetical protein COLO4_31449 [Corchorus olitorius]
MFGSEETCSKIRESKSRRSPSNRTMDSGKFVFWTCVYLELPVTGWGEQVDMLEGCCYCMMAKSFEVTESPVHILHLQLGQRSLLHVNNVFLLELMTCLFVYTIAIPWIRSKYSRCILITSDAVLPTLPYVLSSSDDMLIKLWDWEKGWVCIQIFDGHSHYVMQVTSNPKDTITFAIASLEHTIKLNLLFALFEFSRFGTLAPGDPNFTLYAHQKGVNCVDYFTGGGKPYLITGSEEHTAKVWDYQTNSCVQTLEGHTHNVSAVCFRPELPIIITVTYMNTRGALTILESSGITVLGFPSAGGEVGIDARKGGWHSLDTGQVLIESACSVDLVVEALSTLLPMLPGIQYFRFNPVIFKDLQLPSLQGRRHYPPPFTQPLDRSALGVLNSVESEKYAPSSSICASFTGE